MRVYCPSSPLNWLYWALLLTSPCFLFHLMNWSRSGAFKIGKWKTNWQRRRELDFEIRSIFIGWCWALRNEYRKEYVFFLSLLKSFSFFLALHFSKSLFLRRVHIMTEVFKFISEQWCKFVYWHSNSLGWIVICPHKYYVTWTRLQRGRTHELVALICTLWRLFIDGI